MKSTMAFPSSRNFSQSTDGGGGDGGGVDDMARPAVSNTRAADTPRRGNSAHRGPQDMTHRRGRRALYGIVLCTHKITCPWVQRRRKGRVWRLEGVVTSPKFATLGIANG